MKHIKLFGVLSIIFILSLEQQLGDKLRYKHKSARYYMSVEQKLVCPSLLLYEVHFKVFIILV